MSSGKSLGKPERLQVIYEVVKTLYCYYQKIKQHYTEYNLGFFYIMNFLINIIINIINYFEYCYKKLLLKWGKILLVLKSWLSLAHETA